MRKRTLYSIVLLLVLLSIGSAVLAGDTDFCPAVCSQGEVHIILPSDNTPVSAINSSIPRNQVLLEIFTATW